MLVPGILRSHRHRQYRERTAIPYSPRLRPSYLPSCLHLQNQIQIQPWCNLYGLRACLDLVSQYNTVAGTGLVCTMLSATLSTTPCLVLTELTLLRMLHSACAMLLRLQVRYAMSGPDMRYAPMPGSEEFFDREYGADQVKPAICLVRACYAMSCTWSELSAYALPAMATRCPVLVLVLCFDSDVCTRLLWYGASSQSDFAAYALAMRCPVLGLSYWPTRLLSDVRYLPVVSATALAYAPTLVLGEVSGTQIGYAPTRTCH